MLNNDKLAGLSERLAKLFPPAAGIQAELRTRIEQTLRKGFTELDLMTREEFDVQAQILARAQGRLSELELQVAQLEQKLAAMDAADSSKSD